MNHMGLWIDAVVLVAIGCLISIAGSLIDIAEALKSKQDSQ
jgi:hypothetical protein